MNYTHMQTGERPSRLVQVVRYYGVKGKTGEVFIRGSHSCLLGINNFPKRVKAYCLHEMNLFYLESLISSSDESNSNCRNCQDKVH